MLSGRPGKEPLGGIHIPALAQEKIDGAARFIDRSVQVDPLGTHLQVRFVHPPGIPHRQGVPLPAFLEVRDVALHPTKDGRVGQGNAPFGPSSGPGHGNSA